MISVKQLMATMAAVASSLGGLAPESKTQPYQRWHGLQPKKSLTGAQHRAACNNGGKGRPHQGAKECARRRRQLELGEYVALKSAL